MNYDTLIIGGGLSGLICGIKLQEEGKECLLLSSGQSSLYINPGSFDLLGSLNGAAVKNPVEAISNLNENHPYRLIGSDRIENLANEVKQLMSRVGMNMNGSPLLNHYRISPIGNLSPAWLSDEYIFTIDDNSCDNAGNTINNNAGINAKSKLLIITLDGYMDFPTEFLAQGLSALGNTVDIKSLHLDNVEAIRKNPSEMRSVNICRVLEQQDIFDIFCEKVKSVASGYDLIVLPSVIGLRRFDSIKHLETYTGKKIRTIATLPPSLSGIKIQSLLRKRFESLGGTFIFGEKATGYSMQNGIIDGIFAECQEDILLKAKNYVLATGSFISHGLESSRKGVSETVFGLDLIGSNNIADWYNPSFFEEQPYMKYGVKTDRTLHGYKDGEVIDNLYVVGSILGGADRIKESSSTGISALTGLYAAQLILEKDNTK